MLIPETHCIVLGQGTQRRLTGVTTPKQLLPLPACGGTAILARTIRQVSSIFGAERGSPAPTGNRITVVTWPDVMLKLNDLHYYLDLIQLADPGNSSLKGISRYLALAAAFRTDVPRWPMRTVVLLGDVVYSWACLKAIFDISFVGTSDLGPGGGELWGLSWWHNNDQLMRTALDMALTKHSKHEDEYQPGQLRHWLWAVDSLMPGIASRTWWTPCDDYTCDIDLPADLDKLEPASVAAAADDARHGMKW